MHDSVSRAWFAHSGLRADRSDWQPLSDHLLSVAQIAAREAGVFGGSELAAVMGLLHDLGKYTAKFQGRLNGDPTRVDHSTAGAKEAANRYGALGTLLAYGIAGHHAGLANGIDGTRRTALRDRLEADLPVLDAAWQAEIDLPKAVSLPNMRRHEDPARGGFQLSFLVRMLFSCLVDADYVDTEAFYDRINRSDGQRNRPAPSLQSLREQLDSHLARFVPDTSVNTLRADILSTARSNASSPPGLFSLTVPTGGGKTLASLAFALDHALAHDLRRVIVVIPFTSIVEQTARVFREALGPLGSDAVLEHHSAFDAALPPRDEPDRYQSAQKLRLAMENWDAPIVVTTAVQFFESLFASRPSQCRKLHNIAGSVVVLDEAQTLPLKHLRPCVAAIDELARNYCSTVVLCTATQPALEAPQFDGGFRGVRELAPDPPALFRQLERVRVDHLGVLDDEALQAQLLQHERVLCIVNNRRHARAVYQALAHLPGTRHLSTLMCAAHRSEVLREVRGQLDRGEPCRLISTSLIEAGVDVSFPVVYRAEAGLDSIAQAAGRCNRHGERPASESRVHVFATANDDWAPPAELKQFAQAGREILRQHSQDPLTPVAIEAYFRLLYWQRGDEDLDKENLLGLLGRSQPGSLPMETLAEKFRLIDSLQYPVIVPWDDNAQRLIERLRYAEKSGGLARQLQRYLVQLPKVGYDALRATGAVQAISMEKWGEQFMELACEDLYDPRSGVRWDEPTFLKSENNVW
ncbi:MAG: CRISPR-associated endonuclease Cas3'' [Xanthomonadales bacterium]|nr:CRISPR-associated endonuclease Cas3'' [Xanthomonadales bacterium]